MNKQDIKITKTSTPKTMPDFNNLPFGHFFTDHMFTMDYTHGKGWHSPRIEKYANLELDPAAMVLHYGQANFEGMKAYKHDGKVLLFRPYENFKRLNLSNERICIPTLDVEFAVEALLELVKLDYDWVPAIDGTTLYIRPFVIATDPHVGVKPSLTYKFIIIACPVGAYYPEGINPVKIYVESNICSRC